MRWEDQVSVGGTILSPGLHKKERRAFPSLFPHHGYTCNQLVCTPAFIAALPDTGDSLLKLRARVNPSLKLYHSNKKSTNPLAFSDYANKYFQIRIYKNSERLDE